MNYRQWVIDNIYALTYSYDTILPKYINKKTESFFQKPTFEDWCIFLYEHSD